MVGGFEAFLVAAHADGIGVIPADNINLAFSGDSIGHTQAPVAGVDQQPAKALVMEVSAVTHCSHKNTARFSS